MENYKEKYEDALERARVWKEKSGMPVDKQGILDDIFPELKESEDEKIRKELIRAFTVTADKKSHEIYGNGITYGQVLAWLEKQGEKIDVIKNFNTEFEKQVSHLIASTINKEYEYTSDFVKWTANALLNYAKHEFEKQGEQKLKKVSLWKHWKDGIAGNGEDKPMFLIKNGDTYSLSSCLGYECDYIELSELNKLLPSKKQDEQKPTWSEEDEKTLNSILNDLSQDVIPDNEDIHWLKSFKERMKGE